MVRTKSLWSEEIERFTLDVTVFSKEKAEWPRLLSVLGRMWKQGQGEQRSQHPSPHGGSHTLGDSDPCSSGLSSHGALKNLQEQTRPRGPGYTVKPAAGMAETERCGGAKETGMGEHKRTVNLEKNIPTAHIHLT